MPSLAKRYDSRFVWFSRDSERFCREALEHAGVALTPGIDFGRHRASDHVRFSYTIDEPKLREAIERLRRWLRG